MTTRSHKDVEGDQHEGKKRREFMTAILADLRALERMLQEGRFETGVRRIGAEQEMFLIDRRWAPAQGALKMLERLADSHYTTELGHVPARGQRRSARIRPARASRASRSSSTSSSTRRARPPTSSACTRC